MKMLTRLFKRSRRAGEYNYSLLAACGEDVYIHEDVDIKRPELVYIGNHVAIDRGFVCTTALDIKGWLHIGPYVTVIGGKTAKFSVGHACSIAAKASIICLGDEHKGHGLVGALMPKEFRDRLMGGQVIMEDYSALGTASIVFPGLTLGRGSVLGASSVLKKNSSPWMMYAGNPARAIMARWSGLIENYGELLRNRP